MIPAIEARGVSYTYPDGAAALSEIGFSIAAGECLGLVGPSGAGKSTLILCLAGFLLPEGELMVGGTRVEKKGLAQVRKKLGVIFQNPDDQLFMPTVFEDVAFGLAQRGVRGEELERRVKAALAERGLGGLEKKFPGRLSSGQKRLAALAGVLALEPDTLLLDEPTANLDPRARRQLINHLAGLTNARLIASHDLELVLDLCSRLILLSQGRVIAIGPPAELLADRALVEAHGLEVPHSLLPHREPCRHRHGTSRS